MLFHVDMIYLAVYSKELECDATTTAMEKGDTAPENFGIYSFVEHDRFDSVWPV